MRCLKILTIIVLPLLMIACGSNSEKKSKNFSIETNTTKNAISNSETLTLSIKNSKNYAIDSVVYKMNNQKIKNNLDLSGSKLGKQVIEATVYYNDKNETVSTNIIILSSEAPKIYTFNIINEYPHDITSYTQGLEFYNGELYESTGQLGKSKLRKVNYKTGEVLENIDLAKEYFGEGLTILNNNIYQLTWQSGIGFVYDVNTFEKKSNFKYGKSKEGWGLCNDGKVLYKSDGTENIWILDPETLVEKDHIQVYRNKGKVENLNELEWINGKIYSNSYQNDGVAIINPKNGAVEGLLNFSSLKKKVKQHPTLDVLNGIAYNPDTKTIFVTGKHWDKLFEIEIVEN
ncbi:glutaminyl-peptide cyclotransferase [Flavobacteriaceae bacterium S0825]|uniref:glutaminyl-peptide cyclotransferase n=1 Tax=Gaetbulibacter sp. S0825 TaxID=2720084 RepID=UPI001430B925|nr:glutaminyl-peptide cyclotransferase [Gaetbulibacter sp. S0825]MCK0109226.1 glutaminyl-peptide cyclotransferase [Flavobacteriaceae bacterium S0825]NIX64861.1 glutaminyl-peptide cyclotransferase [Gaetbulibacter sp. S0825]